MNLTALPAGPLRIVFLGTPDLAASVLRELWQGPDTLVGAFTKPDARKGRGLQWLAPPVKDVAEEYGIPVYQPENWRDSTALDTLRSLQPDLAITAAYGRILPQAALEIPKFGCLNVHASLLPRWRGADPIRQAILAGDAETGITIMEMVLEMDLLAKGLGYTSEQVSTFIGRQISRTGEANLDMLRSAAIYSKKFANATGDNFKFIAANIEAITADTENFGNVNDRETARISSNLRQMGLGFEDLQGSVKKFQTFESAADSVAALTTVFGVQMDAMEMFKLANEDQGEFLLKMREQFLATGRSADDLSLAEKRLMQQQLGLQDVESVDRLFDVDAMIMNADVNC